MSMPMKSVLDAITLVAVIRKRGPLFARFSDTPFDCDSFMLYGTETFSTGKPTMVPVNETACDLRWP